MYIEKKYKLDKIVANDEYKPVLKYILIDKEKAVATNGHMFICVPIEREEYDVDDKVLLDKLVFELARKFNPKRKSKKIRIKLNAAAELNECIIPYPGILPSSYPNWESVMPSGEAKFNVGINVDYLKTIADAIGTKHIQLGFYAANKAIKITPRTIDDDYDKNLIALLMPIRIEDELIKPAPHATMDFD